MKYGIAINDGRSVTGNREEMRAIIAGALLATGYTLREPTALEKADFVLSLADGLPQGEMQGLDLGDNGDLSVWRERGREVPGRAYFVKAGDIGPAFRATSEAPLVAYLMGILVGSEGIGLERAAALAEGVAHCLSEGGSYPDHTITELKDGTDLHAWWEDEK